MSNLQACDATLAVLRGLGRIEEVDTAQVEALRGLAAAVDAFPANAQLWKQYREALSDLMEVDDDVDDGLADALSALERATEVGHQTKD